MDITNEEKAQQLSGMIHAGKHAVPETHEPLVCKPREVEPWRMFKIMAELTEGFEVIKKYGLAASFFGTARSTFEPHFYEDASALAGKLANAGFAIITGGSAGIMEAANKGAFEAGGASVGLNIRLTSKQAFNNFLTESATFDHFFVRKVMLTYASEVYIYFPGGFGTLDEFFEIVTLVQTKKIQRVPIILFGSEYWNPLIAFMKQKMLVEHGAIEEEDLNLFYVTDTVDDAFAYIQKSVKC